MIVYIVLMHHKDGSDIDSVWDNEDLAIERAAIARIQHPDFWVTVRQREVYSK